MAGGIDKSFRGKAKALDAVRPLGICHHLGIEMTFAMPENGQAKVAERAFASLSRVCDDRPEFAGAHAGHAPGAAPDSKVVPVPLAVAEQVIGREVARHNALSGRRGQGMRGRSCRAVLAAGLAQRVRRQPTARQLYLAGLICSSVSVDRWGRVQVDNWTYGGPDTQETLLRHHGKGPILLARDPDDLSAPALAWNAKGDLICEGIEPVLAGAYASVDGIRTSKRNRKAARDAVAAGVKAADYLSDERLAAHLAAIPTPGAPVQTPGKVVAVKFGGTLRRQVSGTAQPRAEPDSAPERTAIPAEMAENLRRAEAARLAKRGYRAG